MDQNTSKGIKRYRIPLLIAGSVLIVGVLSLVAYQIISRGRSTTVTGGRSNPVYVSGEETDPSSSQSPVDLPPRRPVELSIGQAKPVRMDPVLPLAGEPLPTEEVERILTRLPDLIMEPEDQLAFNLPAEPIPPPRPGETIQGEFPPPPSDVTRPQADSGPLEVLRYSPEGEIPLAPFINITFNQPMVALTSLEDLAAEEVPVIVEPAIPGTWRWLGTKTLNFEHDSTQIDRLPKATEYQVTVPSGTTSAIGGVLAESVQWTFTTPPPQITNKYPSDIPQPREPLIFIHFDQRIEPRAVLTTIQLSASGDPIATRLATANEIIANETVNQLVERAKTDRYLVFRPQEPLPTDTTFSVHVGPGTPSAEGPLVTEEMESFSFRTYAPLRIIEHGCRWYDEVCRPLIPLYIRFNNPLDVDAYDDSLLTVNPPIPGATVNIFGDTLQIQGATEGQKTYRITVDAALKDIFGQTLGKDETLTFRVGPAEPFLTGPDLDFVTLDPAAEKPTFSVYTINYNKLDVKIYAVQPSNWPDYKVYLQEYHRQDPPPRPPGKLVFDETVPVEAPSDVLTEVPIDLSEVMDGDYGQFIIIVEPARGLSFFNADRDRFRVQAWVQVTDIALDAFVDHSEMFVWGTDLLSGAPLGELTVEGYPRGLSQSTDASGMTRFDLPASGFSYLVGRLGADQVLLPESTHAWSDEGWQRRSVDDELIWYVIDDRQMYRPGEQVHIKGWLRRMGGRQNGDVSLSGADLSEVSYSIIGSQGNELGTGRADLNAFSGFDFVIDLPENVNLGYAQVVLNVHGDTSGMYGTTFSHDFQIQEFRRPEFEVTARNETTGPYYVDEYAILAVSANYYAGGPLPNAEVEWGVSTSPTNYQPPNWPEYNFGIWEPWWWYYSPRISYEVESFSPYWPGSEETEYETFYGVTDAAGEHYLRLDFDPYKEPRPYSVLAEATVFDVNRQAWTGTTSALVHPGKYYVGMRSARTFVQRGDPLEIELIVTDIDGNPISDQLIQVSAARLEWKYRKGDWQEVEADVQECQIGSQEDPVSCTFKTDIGGKYQITAEVSDQEGRPNMSQFTRWVSGGKQKPARNVEQEDVTLIPDKESYQPGDVAEILVQSPFSPAEGLLTVARSGVLYTERFQLEDGSYTLRIPIGDEHIPNLHLQVDLVGSAPRLSDAGEPIDDIPPRPAFALGSLTLDVPPLVRTLALELTPKETELEPGGTTTLDLELTDSLGEPVSGAELAVIVVDEAILALTNYQLPDPVSVFYHPRSSELRSWYARSSILLVDPLAFAAGANDMAARMSATQVQKDMVLESEAMEEAAPMEAPAAEVGGAAAQAEPIRMRSDFNPLATFAPEVRTDSFGRATVDIKLPDNLTRYRIMVVAVDNKNQFGSAESNLTARLPIMVRPSAPRFLNFGDQFELPVVVQNQTDEDIPVDVVVRASNLIMTGSGGKRVTVPANDRVEVRFPAETDQVGTVRIQVAAVAGDFADAATLELPVYTPATTEAFATYGVIDEGAIAQPVATPSDVFPQFGGLEVTSSSTALHALSDAVLYLTSYPFECSEQLAARILGVAALRDVLSAFSAPGLPTPLEMEAAVARDIETLAGIQNYDGGFPYWQRGRDSIPYNTIHVAHALQMAEVKGYQVPAEMQSQVLEYLRYIEDYYPDWYSKPTRQTLSAYALYVRDLMGDTDLAKAQNLLDEAGSVDKLSFEALGWLWMVLVDDPASTTEVDEIRSYVNNRAVETAGAANFTTSYDEQDYLLLRSDRRIDAILLDAYIQDDPDQDLIPKLVNGLLAHRTQGRWGNTQENVFVLLALDRYFNTFESQTPDFVARFWLGETFVGEYEFSGYSNERAEVIVPMSYLVDSDEPTQDLILQKDGTGRLYYRLGMRYAPTDLKLDPLEMGFVVERHYEAIDNPEDVHQTEDGTWHIKAGARVRVRVKMVADNRRYHVALVDPLPAGLEIVNPDLAVSGSLPQDPDSPDYRYGWWWWGTWYEHQNMRDQRAEAFTSLLWDGVYDYNYIARATTPGTFVVPPAKAEEMYSPEVFGRSSSDLVIVE